MIKRVSIAGVLLMLGLASGHAQTSNTYVLVGLTGYDGAKTFDVVSTNAFTDLVREAKLDNEALPRAYANLANAWRDAHAKSGNVANQPSHPEPFPLKSPAPREVRQLGLFGTADAAKKQKQELEGQEAARLKRLEADEERRKPPAPVETGLKRPPRRAPSNVAQAPDPTVVKETLAALVSEIATVRADIAAGVKAAATKTAPASAPKAPKAPPKTHHTDKTHPARQ